MPEVNDICSNQLSGRYIEFCLKIIRLKISNNMEGNQSLDNRKKFAFKKVPYFKNSLTYCK